MKFVLQITVIIFFVGCVKSQILSATCGRRIFTDTEITSATLPSVIPDKQDAKRIIINYQNCFVEKIHVDAFLNYTNIFEIHLTENNIQDLVVGTFINNIYLEVLSLEDNILERLHTGLFINQQKLKKLYLQNNKIYYINKHVFITTYSLELLNLAGNKLEYLNENLFQNAQKLTYLNLGSNSISYLDKNSFSTLKQLKKLYLNNNKITYIHKNLFENLNSLIQLELSYNLISNIEPHTFDKNLKLKYLWINDKNIVRNPEKLNHIEHLQLLPELNYEIKTTMESIVGNNITLSCSVKNASTLNKIFWLKQGYIYEDEFIITNKTIENGGVWHNLTINGITKEDEGTYTCISDEENPSKTFVKLIAFPKKSEKNAWPWFICSIIIILLIIIFMVIYKKCKKKGSHSNVMEQKNETNSAIEDQLNYDMKYSYAYSSAASYAYIEPNEITSTSRDDPLIARNFSLLERQAS